MSAKKKKNKSSANNSYSTRPVEIVTKVSNDEQKEKVENNAEVKESVEVISQKELARQVNDELKRLREDIKKKQDEEVRRKHEEKQKENFYQNIEPIMKAGPVQSDRVEEPEKEEKKEKKKKDKKKSKNLDEEKTKVVDTEAINKEEKKEPKQLAKIKKNELIKNKEESKKRMIYGGTIAVVTLLVLFVLSTVFSLVNIDNPNMIKGVKVQDIDVSGLSKEEAKTKVLEALNSILFEEIKIKQGEYETEFDYSMIEYSYDMDKAIDKAYSVGRSGNIIQNNYSIIKAITLGNNIEVDGKYNEELLDSYVEGIASKVPGIVEHPSYYIEEDKLYVVPGKDGIEVDQAKFKDRILSYVKSIKEEDLASGNYNKEIEIPVYNKAADAIDMQKIADEIFREPKDAYYELEPFKVYPEVDGVKLKISAQEANDIVKASSKEEYEFDLIITPAQKTIKDLGEEAFPYTLSTFSTKYDASNYNRSGNLAIAAGKINGTVLLPGEEFSFNTVVGKRTVEEGYKDAKIYADGKVVDGLAGGICQVSSTLYNAALLADLEITQRRNHSFTTSYIKAGRDATVVYGVQDLKFKNTREYPIRLEGSVSSGVCSFTIKGITENEEYEIKIIPTTTSSIPYGTQTIVDPGLAPGQRVVEQAGHPGYRVTTYKEKWVNGALVSRDLLSNDTYQPMTTIVRVGP